MFTICTFSCSPKSADYESRIYRVDDSFWRYIQLNPAAFPDEGYDDETLAASVTHFLVSMGVRFPEGAYISFAQKDNVVMSRNEPVELDKIEAILDPVKGGERFFIERIVQ